MTDEPVVLGGRYQLEEIIGRGGMAEVWRARDLRLDRLVAIKRLRVDLATDNTFQKRFQREAQAAAGLNHPNIVSVYDTGEKVDPATGISVPYIVMELVEGHTLREILRQGRPIEPHKAFEYEVGVLDALSYSHKHDIVHRDIKPANVMITPSGQVKVMDFGIARAVSDTSATMTQTAAVIGTAQYLSPEQARGEQVDARSDIYSAGCLLYELLTGRPPFLGDSPVSVAYQHVREMPIPPSQLDAEVSPEMDAITMKALAKSTDDRYQSARAMRDDCWRLLNGQSVTARIPAVVAASDSQATGPTRALPLDEDPDYDESYATGAGESIDDSSEPRKRRVSAATIVLISFLALLLAVLGFFAYRVIANDPSANNVQVPTVTGFGEEAAKEQLTHAQLTPRVERVAGPAEGKGTVTKQDPGGGEMVLVGSTVTITINDGPPSSPIPTGIVGKQQDEAIALLKQAGFAYVEPLPAPSNLDAVDAKKGQVVKVVPEEGMTASTDQKVTIYVASGRSTVPADLVGMAEADARSLLQQAGYSNISSAYVSVGEGNEPVNYARGQVVTTRPEVGTPVDKDTPIILMLATGESEMPNVIGLPSAEALEELQTKLGFTAVTVVEKEDTAANVGKVVNQSIVRGKPVPRGSEIIITVGKAPVSVTPGTARPSTSPTTSRPA